MNRRVRVTPRFHRASRSFYLLWFGWCALVCAPSAWLLRAQQPADQSPGNGWTSSWTEPQTPWERSRRQFEERLAAARKSGDFGPLQAEYERQVRDHPDDLAAAEALFSVHFTMKRYGESFADLDRVAEISRKSRAPGSRFAQIDYNRSLVHRNQHDYAAQATDLERAIENDHTFYSALNDLAWLRATNPDAALQNGSEAVQLAKRAVQTAGRHFDDLDTLAAAYAAQGKYSRAASLEEEAIGLISQDVRDTKKSATARQKASARLDLYTHNAPDRETPDDPST